MIKRTLDMDFSALEQLKDTMKDNRYIEYLWHKLLDNPNCVWEEVKQSPAIWEFPECWRARYWLYYDQHRQYLQDAHILDLGSNMNLYGVWALLNGASRVTAIEPDAVRSQLGKEYAQIRKVDQRLETHNINIGDFLNQSNHQNYDIVFFMDVIYYLTNGIDVLCAIKDHLCPKYMFFESTVADDHTEHGHFEIWYSSTDSKKVQNINSDVPSEYRVSLRPSRKALYNIIIDQGWNIISYYDYQDFIGHGESPTRITGNKDFYLLENPNHNVKYL